MKRHWLSFVLIFSILGVFPLLPSQSAQSQTQPYIYYFPVMHKGHVAEVVLTDYPDEFKNNYSFEIGYIYTLVSEPVSATVMMDAQQIGEPWSFVVYPAFPVTLPGQVNPFHWESYTCYSGVCIYISDVYVYHDQIYNPVTGPKYYPLTISSWQLVDNVITGKASHNYSFPLENARVVVAPFPDCNWGEATLQDSLIQPGEQVTFTYNIDSDCLWYPNLVIVGQGVGQP